MPTTQASSTAPTATLPLDQALDAAVCGQKAAALAKLLRTRCGVPTGFVIPVGLQPDPAELSAALERIGDGPWAVRSSALAEDLDDASFAGQYESVLNVTTFDELVTAIARVRASGSTAHVAAYRRNHASARTDGVAVLVQRQVRASAAGIVFSANPVTGDNEVVIEAVRGLGDRLAAGEQDADRWIDDGAVRPLVGTGVIDAATAQRLAEMARQIARAQGAPQDIEWALDGSELHVLQARPITGLPQQPKIEIPPGRWIKDTTHWSGPMTPVGAAILLPSLETAFAKVFAEFGIPIEAIRPRSFGGEVYTQEIEPGGKHNPGSPPPWWAGAIAFRVVPPLRRLATTAEKALPKLESYPRAWEESWRDEWARRLERERKIDLGPLTDDQLLAHLRHLNEEVLPAAATVHFQLMLPDMVALHDLAMCCEELLGWKTAQVLELLAGLSTTATQPTAEMARIAERAGSAAVNAGLDAVLATAAGPQLTEWLDRWGLRIIALDPGSPTIAEMPSLILDLLRQPRSASPSSAGARNAAIARAHAALDEKGRARFDAVLRVAERVHPQREENVLYTQSLPLGLIRRTLLEIGRRLAARGVLRVADDVMFLEPAEIRAALTPTLAGESPAARVRRRRAERAWVRAHPGPAFHGPAPVPPPSPRGLPAGLQRLLRALAWELALEETAVIPAASDGTLVGTGASPGRVTGRVRVIRTEEELSQFQPGEILVCRSTHSSWAVVFARATALVTDHGGALAHPSIVAREYGIPAVVGTGSATTRLASGQTVTVDGTTGRVELAKSDARG